jgi:CPA2 family monovalent cation:H+ antiporter-2
LSNLIVQFSLGIQFQKLKVGGTASITAITQILAMVSIGYLVGQWMLETYGQHIFRVILSISFYYYYLKTF